MSYHQIANNGVRRCDRVQQGTCREAMTPSTMLGGAWRHHLKVDKGDCTCKSMIMTSTVLVEACVRSRKAVVLVRVDVNSELHVGCILS